MKTAAARILLICLITILGACASDGSFDSTKAAVIGAGLVQASLLDETTVKQAASLSAKELDSKNPVAPPNNAYAKRLAKITAGLNNYAGLNLNFKVYLSKDVNAFAMADGTIRVHAGLLDAMPDDQVLAVIGHEIAHVKLQHSYNQMRKQLLTNTAFQAAASMGGNIGSLSSSQLGQLAYAAVNARFSQADELAADEFAVKALNNMGKDPAAMKRAIQTLQSKYGSGGGFLSSHPSNKSRLDNIQAAINKL